MVPKPEIARHGVSGSLFLIASLSRWLDSASRRKWGQTKGQTRKLTSNFAELGGIVFKSIGEIGGRGENRGGPHSAVSWPVTPTAR